MSSNQATTITYYLYVNNAWTGPFDIGQLRFFLRQHQVAADTYAYDPERQSHHTVGELLAGHEESGVAHPAIPPSLEPARSTTRVFSGAEDTYHATSLTTTATFDHLGPDLRGFYQAYLDLTEDRAQDREASLRAMRDHRASLAIQLSAAVTDVPTLRALCEQAMHVGDYLANRHQDPAVWDRLEVLRGANPDNDADDAAQAASAVVDILAEKAERAKPGVKAEVVREGSDRWEQPGLRTAKGMMADARAELVHTVDELQKVQKAYAELQDRSAAEIDAARDAVAAAESRRADEEAHRRQVVAEVRSLSAEIHRLGHEYLGSDPTLRDELVRLAEELAGDNATAMVPLAESLLIRLVTRLRRVAGGETGDLASLREELAQARAELVQVRAQALSLSDERDRLKRQLEDQRLAAERAMASARGREQRLRSTVSAMEVTRDVHQDVMRELEAQLTSAQTRVSTMEAELASTRGELQTTRVSLDEKSTALQDEMRRAVDLKAMLEARREELSANLRTAEAELHQAQQAPDQANDPEFVEALAAKVNHLRTTFETTKRKLDEQRAIAARLEDALAQSRREAQELRGRSDALSLELDDARANLSSAKRRFEELQLAYSRLEHERQSLQQEVSRKGTDSISRDGTGTVVTSTSGRLTAQPGSSSTQRLAKVVADLEARLAEGQRRQDQAGVALDQERQRARQAQERLASLTANVEELTAERQHLRHELEQLHAQHFAEHSRHAAALATATQATIEAERRAKDALSRVVELEQDLAEAQPALTPLVRAEPGLEAELARLRAEASAKNEEATALRAEATALRAELDRLATASPAVADNAAQARLAALEEELARTVAERTALQADVTSATREAERLGRDLARLRNEHESAAVEHRAALKSARDRLTEAQARVQRLEDAAESSKADATRLAGIDSERDRLAAELARAQAALASVAAGQPAQERMLADLAEAGRALAAERERVQTLERAVAEFQRAADEAQRRAVALEERGGTADADHDRLTLELERIKGELAMAQAAASAARTADAARIEGAERRVAEIAADREHLLGQLGHVHGELSVARQRVARLESDAIGAERLALEQSRVKELEARLDEARHDHQAALAMAADARTRLAQVHAERDRLHVEVERLRAVGGPGGADAAELAELRARLKRLVRGRRQLRAERDDLKQQLERALAAVQQMPVTTHRVATEGSLPAQDVHDALDPLPAPAAEVGGLTARAQRASASSSIFTAATATHDARVQALGFTASIPRTGVTVRLAPAEAHTMTQRTLLQQRGQERRRLMRTVALGAGIAVLGGLGIMTAARTVPMADRAVINATLQVIRSPIAGRIQTAPATPGVLLHAGEPVVTVVNPTPDQTRVKELERRQAGFAVELQGLENAHQMRVKRQAVLQDQLREQKARLLAEAEAAAVQCRKELAETQAAFRGRQDGEALLQARTEALTKLEARLALFRAGQFPAELLDAQRALVALEALEVAGDTASADVDRRRIAGEVELTAAREEVERQRLATVPITEDGVLWRRDVAMGDWVAAQGPVALVAQPASVVVEGFFPERYVEQVREGESVCVLVGGEVVRARVMAVQRDGLPLRREPQAIDLPASPGRVRVVAVMPHASPTLVGQSVRMWALSETPGLFEKMLVVLARILR